MININKAAEVDKVFCGLIKQPIEKLSNETDLDGSTVVEELSKIIENALQYMEAEGWISDWKKIINDE
jgi:hypothetical protein